jgi:hypothetical protein
MTDLNLQDLDDFDSPELETVAPADHGYLASMWGGHSFRAGYRTQSDIANDTVVAHGMVQTFVNAFARDGKYIVNFNAATETAGTDTKARTVVITPAPIADSNLTAEQAGLILTGLAVHEISHPRYGKRTAKAVQDTFPGNRVADRLSNVLDDVRIERRFIADYPGYAGVFEPVLDYVGKASTAKHGHWKVTLAEPTNLAIAAIRYPSCAVWTAETMVERTWWTDWAERGSKEDAPARHVGFIREALQHIADTKPAPAPKAANQAKMSGSAAGAASEAASQPNVDADDELEDAGEDAEVTQSNPAPEAETASTSESKDASGSGMSDDDLNEATQDADPSARLYADKLPDCSGSEAVDKAAKQEGVDAGDIRGLKQDADHMIANSRNVEDDGHGNAVDVARSVRGISHGRAGAPSSMAMRYIRNAILRSRTGNTDTTGFQKRGRLDQSGLSRLASGDARIFERRTAPAPGKYLVWLMIDCSSSMRGGTIEDAASVAHAIAAATGGTPSVRMAVWGWSYPFRPSPAGTGVAKVWESGQDVNEIFRVTGLRMGGTPDATAMSWSARAILKARRHDETPVIIFASDGAGDNNMNQRVDEARKLGVVVKSVSFGWGFSPAAQVARFGRGNTVPWAGSMTATARGLADLFAKITSGR